MEKVCSNCFKPCEGNFCPYCGYEQGSALKRYTLALPEGSVLDGRYIVGRVLGQGGFGITYAAQDYNTKSLVAIKEFFPDSLVTRTSKVSVSTISADRKENFEYGKECFLKEAETLSHFIGHPNIVTIYSYFEENNTAYLAMEYLDGESFLDYLRRNGKKSWEETRKICEPVMDALAFVHSKGLIHRDISPDNIFMCKDGTVKLIDFGAARYSLGNRSQSLSVVLKHGFAPMEQYTRRGHQGPYTDIYALAATMYRAVTGKIPPEAHDRMYDDELLPPTSLGADMPDRDEKALLKALAFDYNDRWQTVGEFRSALSEIKETKSEPEPEPEPEKYATVAVNDKVEETSEEPKPLRDTGPKPEEKKTKGLIISLVAVIVAVAVVIAGVAVWKNSKTASTTHNTSVSPDSSESLANEVEWDDHYRAEYEGITYALRGEEVYVFDADDKLTSAEIAEKINGYAVTGIDEYAFNLCINLTSVTIPDSVASIGKDVFITCTSLKKINVGNGNTKYCSFNGDLYNKEKTELIQYAAGKTNTSFVIPDSVTSIGDYAFKNCSNLKSITIPDSVTSIGRFAFYNCDLTEVSVPGGCDIDEYAFDKDVKITYR